MSDEIEEIRARWRAVGDAHERGQEINPLTLLLAYAADTLVLLDICAASEARAASHEAEVVRLRDGVAQAVGAFASGIYCANCGHVIGDGCECVVERLRALLALPAADQPASCTEDRHIVLPSGEACACGENRSELLL
jgi:hypothetical protein